MNNETFEKGLRDRAAERRQKLSADIVALTLEEVANALNQARKTPSESFEIPPPQPPPPHEQ